MGTNLIIQNADFSENGFTPDALGVIESQLQNAVVKAGLTSFATYNVANLYIGEYDIRSTLLIPKADIFRVPVYARDVTNGNYGLLILPSGCKRMSVTCDEISGVKFNLCMATMAGVGTWDGGAWYETGAEIARSFPFGSEEDYVLMVIFDTNIGTDKTAESMGLTITAIY